MRFNFLHLWRHVRFRIGLRCRHELEFQKIQEEKDFWIHDPCLYYVPPSTDGSMHRCEYCDALGTVISGMLQRIGCRHYYIRALPEGAEWWCPGCRRTGKAPDIVGRRMTKQELRATLQIL